LKNQAVIQCEWRHSFRDFDGGWADAQCTAEATWHLSGYDIEGPIAPDDNGRMSAFACDDHSTEWGKDLTGLVMSTVTTHFRLGYQLGQSEAELAELTDEQVHTIVWTGEDIPAARTPLTGEWAGEAVNWPHEHVEQFREGFSAGWEAKFATRAWDRYTADIED